MLLPLFMVIVVQMKRMATQSHVFAYCYLTAAVSGATLFALADIFFLVAAFRPGRDLVMAGTCGRTRGGQRADHRRRGAARLHQGRMIIRYSMEVRTAPRWLKVTTDAWLVVCGARSWCFIFTERHSELLIPVSVPAEQFLADASREAISALRSLERHTGKLNAIGLVAASFGPWSEQFSLIEEYDLADNFGLHDRALFAPTGI